MTFFVPHCLHRKGVAVPTISIRTNTPQILFQSVCVHYTHKCLSVVSYIYIWRRSVYVMCMFIYLVDFFLALSLFY